MKEIPGSHLDLIDGPYTVALSTVMPDGQPETTPVWCNRKDGVILINVMKGFRKEKNMRINPHVSLLAYDPKNPIRNIEIRGCVVEMTEGRIAGTQRRTGPAVFGQVGCQILRGCCSGGIAVALYTGTRQDRADAYPRRMLSRHASYYTKHTS